VSAPRLAFFSPVPPARTGIASYVAGLLPLLPDAWEIEIFAAAAGDPLAGYPVHGLDEWAGRNAELPFDLNVYQVGNSPDHLPVLPHVLETPGLLVLHDVILHPMRVAAFLDRQDLSGYREALTGTANAAAVAEVVAAGLGGPSIYWNFPLSGDLVRASRHTVVHGEMLASWLRAEVPDADIGSVPLWLPVPDADATGIAEWRAKLGASEQTPLLGTFGHLGPEHRVDLVLAALADLAPEHDFRVVLVGSLDPAIEAAVERAASDGVLANRVTATGHVTDADYGALLRAVDLGVNLRYPTARAASGPLAQLLSVGTPAVIHDLVHQRDIPEPAVLRVPTGCCDEERAALRGVVRAWLEDTELRVRAAETAGQFGAANVTPSALAAGYERAVERALGRPAVT